MLQEIKINSNITLFYIPMQKLKTTSAGLYIHRPLCSEQASENAVLPAILKRASLKYPSTELLTKHTEELYGATVSASVAKKGEDQVICLETETISNRYAPNGEKLTQEAVELLLELVFSPLEKEGAFDSDIFLQEQKNALDRIDAMINDKRSYAAIRCSEITTEGTPYSVSRLGTKEGVSKLTAKGLYDYYMGIITSSVIDIFVSGDADIDEIADVIRTRLSGMSFGEANIPATEPMPKSDEVKNVCDSFDVVQGKLSLGFVTGVKADSGDYPKMLVASSIFGGGPHSKLFNNVREKLSLAYYAGSQYQRLKGIIIVNSGVEFENFQKAKDEILVQLDNVKNGVISDTEIEAAKAALINSIDSYYDDQGYMRSYYLGE